MARNRSQGSGRKPILEPLKIDLPRFLCRPGSGKTHLENVKTDLVLIPVVQDMEVPLSLHIFEPHIGDQIRQSIEEDGFNGQLGQQLLLTVPLPNSKNEATRYILLQGIGNPDGYDGEVAFETFLSCLDTAHDLGVEHITLPFVSHPSTGNALPLRTTAFRLKQAVTEAAQRRAKQGRRKKPKPASVNTVQIFCTPAAEHHIREGLAIEIRPEDCEE